MTVKGLLSLVFHRVVIVVAILLFQFVVLMGLLAQFNHYFMYFDWLGIIISVIAVLWIVDKWMDPGYKIAWIIPILVFPVVGGLLYIFLGGNMLNRRAIEKMEGMDDTFIRELGDYHNAEQLSCFGLSAVNQSRYIQDYAHCPPFSETETQYFSLVEDIIPVMLQAMKDAEHYIFLEYFIINKGVLWNDIFQILEDKAQSGVEVRIIYDDVGSMFSLTHHYPKQLAKSGIKCKVFNPFIPVLSTHLNHRDHRKLCIIDGHTAFTGGFNLADEYINHVERFGHWKDNGLMLRGAAVRSTVVMFLSMWDYIEGTSQDYEPYYPKEQPVVQSFGQYVQPYTDSPLDNEPVGEAIYLNLISKAERYVYITTPYLIPSDSLIRALCNAAKGGVDIRIITPHIPDKKTVFILTQAHYEALLEAGVRIYEYTPGFMHAKLCVVDDIYATVGSVNIDYRSMFLHFEAGVWLCHDPCILDMKADFMDAQVKSQEIELESCLDLPWPRRVVRAVLRIFGPFL